MFQSEERASVDLLTMQVNHLIDGAVLVLMLKDVEFSFFLFELILSLSILKIIAFLHLLVLSSSSLGIPFVELSTVNLFLSFFKWYYS